MNKFLIVPVLVLLSLQSKSQAPFPTADEIKQFMASKTCVVLEDDPFSSFNAFVKDAVKSFWTVTPVEYISITEFNKRRTNPAYSFIVLTQTNFEKDKTGGLFNFVNLIQGKKNVTISENPEICAVPLSFAGVDDIEYGYKLGVILAFMQNHARMISEDPSLTGRRYLRYYNINAPQVMTKTILVEEEDLAPEVSTPDEIKAVYPFPFKIVTEEEIVNAINNKTPGTLVLHRVGPTGEASAGLCFKMLFGVDDAVLYYWGQHKVSERNPNGLLESDLDRLARYK